MKTILYQPLFINPQAYFVFPQLYHIEKGDSYIEPANITGQLIINDLTKSLTLTPILNVVQDTNQVDFGLFKGKHIRISQYTNIGSVVLGEWYVPGTPTPPEPEQPDWFKESIVAWYSPYCKQGMTNYDVIEAYVEDFTDWYKEINNGTVTATNKSFHFTEVKKIGSTNAIVRLVSHRINGEIKLNIKGVTEDNPISFTEYSTPVLTVNKDGVYTLVINDATVGIYFTKVGVVDVTVTQLPTSILKDFSGNKHDAYLYGFKGKLNSGVGIYKVDFSKSQNVNAFDNFERFNNKFVAKGRYNGNWSVFGQYTVDGVVKNKVTVKITGVSNLSSKLTLQYGYFTKDNKYIHKEMLISKDGIYSYDINNVKIPDENNIAQTVYNRFYFDKEVINDVNLIVEEIPDYPNQLCYDGKSYAVAYGLPILTDYTIIADRTWFKDKVKSWSYFIDKSKAFVFERTSNGNNFSAKSFAAETSINIEENNVSYQTKTSYNGNVINYHSDQSDNDDRLVIGTTKDSLGNQCFIGCHSDILLFNRTLTEYEISWVKNNMMCSKQQEPDIDL